MSEMPHDERWWEIVLSAAVQIRDELAGHGRVLSRVPIDFPAAPGGLAPGLAVIAPGAGRNARGRFEGTDVEAVLEVAGPGGEHGTPARVYAECGIPLFVVIDPAAGVCTVHTAPAPGGVYREAERVPFGNDLFLPLGDRTLVLQTDEFPIERPTPGKA
ncbi:Uma2 family endonuclease [Kitasatospora aureofaciens]|uniref:Uma2 family endonuclease n=1 Tax=Kitasatospora aureofaciens TaxID=1894 RepID=UPI001C493103|nr:Uma2 family endonuclease [Kitasatospora aureofaciens]MBV6699453.1 Uma2 family endonuclease [Kitasatospora aureofaciens]